VQCDQLTDAEIEQFIQHTAAALKRQYVALLGHGRGFPPDTLARNQMIESHDKIITRLEQDMKDLLCCSRRASASMNRRGPFSAEAHRPPCSRVFPTGVLRAQFALLAYASTARSKPAAWTSRSFRLFHFCRRSLPCG
jgi:hypothetical protein